MVCAFTKLRVSSGDPKALCVNYSCVRFNTCGRTMIWKKGEAVMNLPNDMLPEEQEPQYAEMITLLQQAYSKPVPASWERPQQTLSRVRARLMRADLATSSTEEMPIPGVIDSAPSKSKPIAGKHHLNPRAA